MPTKEESRPALVNKFSSSMTMGAVVPMAILLVGAGIVIFISSILQSQSSYRDLVKDLNEKAFGNRWVAAYELSKVLANNKVPEEEIPWITHELIASYANSRDDRTKNFVVLALGSIKSKETIDFLSTVLEHPDKDIRFHAMVALGNCEDHHLPSQWQEKIVQSMLKFPDDISFNVAASMVIAQHSKSENSKIANHLFSMMQSSSNKYIQASLVTALFALHDSRSLVYVKNLMLGNEDQLDLAADQLQNIRLNLIKVAKLRNWVMAKEIFQIALNQEQGTLVKLRLEELKSIL